MRCPAAFCFIEEKAADVLGVNHFQDTALLTSTEENTVLLLMAVCRYLKQDTKYKGKSSAQFFCAAGNRTLRAVRGVFAEVWGGSSLKFDGAPFQYSLTPAYNS